MFSSIHKSCLCCNAVSRSSAVRPGPVTADMLCHISSACASFTSAFSSSKLLNAISAKTHRFNHYLRFTVGRLHFFHLFRVILQCSPNYLTICPIWNDFIFLFMFLTSSLSLFSYFSLHSCTCLIALFCVFATCFNCSCDPGLALLMLFCMWDGDNSCCNSTSGLTPYMTSEGATPIHHERTSPSTRLVPRGRETSRRTSQVLVRRVPWLVSPLVSYRSRQIQK